MAKKENVEKIKYSRLVGSVVEEGLYFRDALGWYHLKYTSIISERTFFIIMSIMSVIVVTMLGLTITNILPLKESFPVLVTQPDSARYYTTIKSMKPKGLAYSSNEAILRLLLIRYVREMFSHDYRTGKIEDINGKFLRVKNYSTEEVLQRFRNDFNGITAQLFNKNITQTVYIRTFKFKEKESRSSGRFSLNSLKKLIITRKIPTEAELDYEVHILTPREKIVQKQRISLDFKFDAIKYNSINRKFSKPVLIVTNYTTTDIGK
ncbi:MAG: hypothetical protein LBU15_02515 [Rickettsiales bacterium]|jgi:type IV secretory pathway component VirB8|nr:hypothetical protein [Rickettsiales bacterium]